MNIDYIERLTNLRGFYQKVKTNPGFRWLVVRSSTPFVEVLPSDATSDYDRMLKKLRHFYVMRILLVAFAIIGYCVMWMGEVLTLRVSDNLAGFFVFLSTFALILIVLPIPFVWRTLHDMMSAWIEREWTTKDFYREVKALHEMNNYKDGISWLIGAEEDVRDSSVPQHVSQKAHSHLIDLAREIKGMGGDKNSSCWHVHVDQKKSHLKYMLNLFQRFQVIDRQVQLGEYYDKAAVLSANKPAA